MIITATQIKAARALLAWPRVRLAVKSGVSDTVIADLERGKREPSSKALDQLKAALEAGGVTFMDGGDPCAKLEEGRGAPQPDQRAGRRGNYPRRQAQRVG
jgi:transcriptional regulator with XRE-family HTH domain